MNEQLFSAPVTNRLQFGQFPAGMLPGEFGGRIVTMPRGGQGYDPGPSVGGLEAPIPLGPGTPSGGSMPSGPWHDFLSMPPAPNPPNQNSGNSFQELLNSIGSKLFRPPTLWGGEGGATSLGNPASGIDQNMLTSIINQLIGSKLFGSAGIWGSPGASGLFGSR